MQVGDAFAGIAGPLGRPSEVTAYPVDQTVVFAAGGLGLPPVHPIMREHLRAGNHVTLIAGFRSGDLMFWTGDDERIGALAAQHEEGYGTGSVLASYVHAHWASNPAAAANFVHACES